MILFEVLTNKFMKDGASQFQKFRVNVHKLYALFSTRLSDCHLSCARWVPRKLTGAQKTQGMALAFTSTFCGDVMKMAMNENCTGHFKTKGVEC
jgi:hypothetical protein